MFSSLLSSSSRHFTRKPPRHSFLFSSCSFLCCQRNEPKKASSVKDFRVHHRSSCSVWLRNSLRSNSLAKATTLISRDSLCENRFKSAKIPPYFDLYYVLHFHPKTPSTGSGSLGSLRRSTRCDGVSASCQLSERTKRSEFCGHVQEP